MSTRCIVLTLAACGLLAAETAQAKGKLSVVATLPTYGAIARQIAGGRAEVRSLARGNEDPHFVRPKPSLAMTLAGADLLISTGLDLELWLPTLLDKANNAKIRSGQPGFVAASQGVRLLGKPKSLSRSAGDVHIYGNPHVYTDPLNGKIIARNILLGLQRVDPAGASVYEGNYKRFQRAIDRRLFGEDLLKILGPQVLTKLALANKLIPFLKGRKFRGKPLLDYLGGWMKQALVLRQHKIVAYHKNWTYFARTFGLQIVAYIEPKPGIPASPAHVASVIDRMKAKKVRVILAANYYNAGKVKKIAGRVGASPVIVGLAVGGEPAITDYFRQFDVWIGRLVAALGTRGQDV